MSNIPDLLNNPDNPLYNLEENEIYSLKEAKGLIDLEKFSFVLFTLWDCVIINLQRRIESFGIKNISNILKDSDEYNFQSSKLKERWLRINEYNLIEYAKTLGIINHVSHDLITTLFWMKSEFNENNESKISKDELYSLIFLLEKNLFIKEFKIDKRANQELKDRRKNEITGRRRDDTVSTDNNISSTHQKLLLQSGVKLFEKNLNPNDKDDKLLNTYI